MNQHRYQLQTYNGMNTRERCPGCGKNKSFTRYIDTETNEQIHSSVGRCNREDQCGYHYSPKQYFIDNGIDKAADWIPSIPKQTEPVIEIFIEPALMKKSLAEYENNNLVKFLLSKFEKETVTRLIDRYLIGTSKHWPGATIFYQIDELQKIRRGKIMLYDPKTGRRDKHKITSVHALRNESDFKPPECFFGLHLIQDNQKTIAICESEKTAMISSLYMPDFIWLASGGLSMLNYEKCKVLKGRNIVLYPDLNGFYKWKEKADLFLPNIVKSYAISSVLEKVSSAEEKKNGLDLADYLLKYNVDQFNTKTAIDHPANSKSEQVPANSKESLVILLNELIEKVPENMSVTIDFKQQVCFKSFIQNAKKGYEANPRDKVYQNQIRSIYRTFHKQGKEQFANKY